MTKWHTVGVAACLTLASAAAHAQAGGAQLAETLKKMDAASATFKSAQADLHSVSYNALLKEDTSQDGSIYVEGKSSKMQMGLKLTGQDARTLDYKNGVLRLFNPGLGCYNKVNSNGGQAESFLTIGFGGSGTDLQKEWQINDLGPETLTSDGKPVKVEKLDLVPKNQSVKNTATHVLLWIDLTRGIGLKQELFSLSNDTRTATYSNIRLNTSINKSPYSFKDTLCK